MKIARVSTGLPINTIGGLLDSSTKEKIGSVNWPAQYPYAPDVTFAMVHDGDYIYIKYWVDEEATLARTTEDFGQIWTDSCVEFFVSFGTGYYNIEFSCVGYGLTSFRITKPAPEAASKELMAKIERYPSLPIYSNFEEKSVGKWDLILKIPKELFFKENLVTLDGIKAKANFYKCGDNLSIPHFISWSPINVDAPNFHLPEFFSDIEFCK